MSLLFDQNLSRRLPSLLAAEYPGADLVILAGLAGADDLTVWQHAAGRGLAVVSEDSDFARLAGAHGPPTQVIWLRVGNGPTRVIADLLRNRLADVRAFLASPSAPLLELP